MVQQVPSDPQIEPQVYQQATQYQLGALVATFKPRITNALAIIGIAIGVIIADIIAVAVIYEIGFVIYLTIAIPILAIIYAIRGLAHRKLRVYQFEQGLIQTDGRTQNVIRWDQVRFLYQRVVNKVYGNKQYFYTIESTDGANFKFTNVLKDVALLGQNMQQAVLQEHWLHARGVFDTGKVLTFGPLSLGQLGITLGGEWLSWDKVQDVKLQRGYITIKKVGKTLNWGRIRVHNVPNLLLVLNLIDYGRRLRQ